MSAKHQFRTAGASLREQVLANVRRNAWFLGYATPPLRRDKEVVMAAVVQDGEVLVRAGDALRDDREVVLAAVRSNGRAIRHASAGLQRDPEILRAAGRSMLSGKPREDEKVGEFKDSWLEVQRAFQKGGWPWLERARGVELAPLVFYHLCPDAALYAQEFLATASRCRR